MKGLTPDALAEFIQQLLAMLTDDEPGVRESAVRAMAGLDRDTLAECESQRAPNQRPCV